jgi:ferritin-like metal-binding protein YciE
MLPRENSTTLFGPGQPPLEATQRFASIHLPGLAEAPDESSHEGAFERHWLRTLAHVLVEEIHELYHIEKMLQDDLAQVAFAVSEPILRFLSQIHAKQTTEQLRRLDQVHQMLGQLPGSRDCLEMDGLLVGLQETIAENQPGRPRDLALLLVTHQIMQREITGYCNARDYAQLLGLEPVAALLQQSLVEETSLHHRLAKLSTLLAPKANGRTIY